MCSLVADCAGLGALFLGITHVVLQLEVLLVDALAAIGLTGAERAAIRTASSNGHSGFIEAIERSASLVFKDSVVVGGITRITGGSI